MPRTKSKIEKIVKNIALLGSEKVEVIIKKKTAKLCPGGRHAWYESNVGLVRKPIQ